MPHNITTETPLQGDGVQTHWEGCWREHHQCAISELTAIDRIMQGVRNAPDAPNGLRDRIRRTVHGNGGQPCGFCGCARTRCEQAPERFGTQRCCTHCDHQEAA